jgi:glycosyltransferase involved in cell wall biosynthesis
VAQNRFESSVYADECKVNKQNILILGSGIDPDEWENADGSLARRSFSVPAGKKIVLSVTSHCTDKGSTTLLDSSIDLWNNGVDFVLVLAGPVQNDFRCHQDARAADIPRDRLIVTGYIREEIRKHLFKAADVIAAPSRLDAFGIVLLDGWISGKPVIGCNAGGMPDIISHGEDGYLIEFGDRKDLSSRIQTLLENEKTAVAMGRSGRKKTLEKYTWRKVTDRFYRRVQEVLE